ncbi:MAG: TlpA disulfide reductase family protein [Pedobacter sp.]|uniref:redoxin domain-containing protein n=1 Tax=Pedobacter sp. TaxID=1411316 RepID=UPI003568ED4C
MKKNIIFFILLVSFGQIVSGQKKDGYFSIQGDLSEIKTKFKKAVLLYPLPNEYITDTATIVDQKFSFSGKVPYPTMASIKYLKEEKGPSNVPFILPIFLESGSIKINAVDGQLNHIKVSGSSSHNEFETLKIKNDLFLKDVIEPLGKRIKEVSVLKDTAKLAELRKLLLEEINRSRESIYLGYVKENPTSVIIYYCLIEGGGIPFSPARIKPYFEGLAAKEKQSIQGKSIREIFESGVRVKPGNQAPDFTLNTPTGKDTTLSSLKGKYVFIDFWASWCAPCRKEVPNVLKAFSNYKQKGFEVLAVSLDEPGSRDKWIKAIHADQSSAFIHVINRKGSINDVAKKYGVSQIPASFLVNPEGKIIAVNLRDEELHKKLDDIFK